MAACGHRDPRLGQSVVRQTLPTAAFLTGSPRKLALCDIRGHGSDRSRSPRPRSSRTSTTRARSSRPSSSWGSTSRLTTSVPVTPRSPGSTDLPSFAELKIDRSFVTDTGERSRTYLKAMVGSDAHSGCAWSPKASKTRKRSVNLVDLDCDLAQGYLISCPLEPAAMTHWLITQSTEHTPTLSGAQA